MFEHKNVQNGTILRDFFIFWAWRHPKRSNSARLPHFSKCKPSKTRILRDFLQKWKVECRADRLVPMRFAIFSLHLCKVLRLPRKIDARSYDVPHLSRKIISANLKIWCSKMQPLSGNQLPDLLTSEMNMSFVLRLPREMHLWRTSSNVPRLPAFLEMPQNPHVLLTFAKMHNPLRLPRESTSERPKVLRTRQFFALLTWKYASRHNGVHFFDIWTSKSGPRIVVCFTHFDFEMCFAPQWRALFSTSQVPKVVRTWCVLLAFWLGNVLRATTACNFSSLIWPAGSDRRPSGAPNHWKNTVFRDFPNLYTYLQSSFLLIFLFSLPLPCSAFHLSILSEVWLLNFLRWSCHDLYALKNVSKLGRPRWQTTRCINM